MKPRYNIVRTLIYDRSALTAFTVDTYTTVTYLLTIKDLPTPGFFICGFHGLSLMMDDAITDYYFNPYADLGLVAFWHLSQYTTGLLGDDFNIDSMSALTRGSLFLQDRVHYNFKDFPIYINSNNLIIYLQIGIFGYTPSGTLKYINSFKIDVGYQDDSEKVRDLNVNIAQQ